MPHSYKPGFGNKLRACLEADRHGRSLRQLALLIKRNPAALNRWLLEERQIPYNDLIWLCRILGLDLEQRAELLDLAGYEVDRTLISEKAYPPVRAEIITCYKPGFRQQLHLYLEKDKANRLQRQLAQCIGRPASLLNHWLNERRHIPYNDLFHLCRVLDLTDWQRAELMQLAGYEVDWPDPPETPDRTLPLQRPPRPVHFWGRQAEIDSLLIQLRPGRVVTLCGPGGIGKSALAAEVIWRLTAGNILPPDFPDGIIYHSFYNQPQVNFALQQIALSFGVEPKPTPRDAALRILARKRALLFLDGVEDADVLPHLLEVRGECGVLMTSRRRQDAPEDWIDVAPLPPDQAVGLLRAWAGGWAADEAASQICGLIDGLPLAVRLVGRYLAQTEETAQHYLAWLAATPLQALDQGRRRQESIPLLLQRSLVRVSAGAQLALAIASGLALAPFEEEVIAYAVDLPVTGVGVYLSELSDYGFLNQSQDTYEISHALIHTYGRSQTPPEITTRLVDYYLDLVQTQSTQGVAGYTRLDTARVHILAVLSHCVDHTDWTVALKLAAAIQSYLDLRGFWTERISALELGLRAAQALGDQSQEAEFLGNLGLVHRDLGQIEQAITYVQQGIATAQAAGDRQQEGICLGNLGLLYQDMGQAAQAMDFYRQAAAISQNNEHYARLGYQLIGLATNLRAVGQIHQAIDYSHQALDIALELQDRRLAGISLTNLGSAHRHEGRLDLAIDYCQQALTLAQETGDRRREGAFLGNLAMAYYAAGQFQQAATYLQQAVAIARAIDDRREESNHLGRLGLALCDLGRPEQAITCAKQALAIAQTIGDRYREGNHLGVLARAYRLEGDLQAAIDYGRQALAVACELGDWRGEGHHLQNLECVAKYSYSNSSKP